MNMKHDRPDEAKIQALRITEHKNRTVVILNDKKKRRQPNCAEIDEESLRGRFGWETVGNDPIPYLIRAGEKYCAVRMLETKALNKYLSCLHPDICSCTCVSSYYVTGDEGRLLNEINRQHCDYYFGKRFTLLDLIVRLSDAMEFYDFLHFCYTKLVNGDFLGRSGFIRIDGESVMAYVVHNDQKYVPLFYFEDENEHLKLRAYKLEGWDLSYLKFCCKIQGIRKEFIAHDSWPVISLDDIKNYLPLGTLFEEFWPKMSATSQLVIGGNTRNQSQSIWWSRPRAGNLTQPKHPTNSQRHNMHSYPSLGVQYPYHTPTLGSAVRMTYPPAAGNAHMKSTQYNTNITQGAQPPLPTIAQLQSNLHYTNGQRNPKSHCVISGEQPELKQVSYHQEEPDESKPPPMIHIRRFLDNGGVLSPLLLRQQRQQKNVVNQRLVQRDLRNSNNVDSRQQSSMCQSSTFKEKQHSIRQMIQDDVKCKLIAVPEPPTSSSRIPYRMEEKLVEGKLLRCINMKPYVNAELLVTLPDLIMNFFNNNIPVQSCQRVMEILGIDLYKPNNAQTRVLKEAGKCQNMNEVVPLVQVRNVTDFMPQLKYMLGDVLT